MSTNQRGTLRLVLMGVGTALILGFGYGCSSMAPAEFTGHTAPSTAVPVEKGGAQLWAQNCMRCHNIRTPSSYTDAEWSVAMQHMRVRANLTAEEHAKILAFLQSAN